MGQSIFVCPTRNIFFNAVFSALLLIYVTLPLIETVVIDNEITDGTGGAGGGQAGPRVYCFQNGMKLQVETKNPFTGRIYVKGQYNNPQCNKNFTGETKQPSLNIAYSECSHNSEKLYSGGMMFTMEVVVQFHPYFTTKIDRGFIISCSYNEAENVVTQNQILAGNVMLPDGSSDSIPVTIVSYSPLLPTCKYTIHRGSPDGPVISFAKVGEKVVHRWQCYPTADGEFHGILVHNCFVRDYKGNNRIQVVDQRGCTLDPFSLGTPTYTMDLTMAFSEVHAYKFADDLQISFSCSISLCLRMNGGCVGITPPNCGGGTYSSTPAGTGGGYGQTSAPSGGGGGGGGSGGGGYQPGNTGGGQPTAAPYPPPGGQQPSYQPGGQSGGQPSPPSISPTGYNAGGGSGGSGSGGSGGSGSSYSQAGGSGGGSGGSSYPATGSGGTGGTSGGSGGSYAAGGAGGGSGGSGGTSGSGGSYPAGGTGGTQGGKPPYSFAKSAPAASVYYPPGYSNSSLSYPPSGPPRGLPAGYEPAQQPSTSVQASSKTNVSHADMPLPPPIDFEVDSKRKSSVSHTVVADSVKNSSQPGGQDISLTDAEIEMLIKELAPVTALKHASPILPGSATTTDSNLGIYVGEGFIDVQQIARPRPAAVNSQLQDAAIAAFFQSKRRDSNPNGFKSDRVINSKDSERNLRIPKNNDAFADSDTEGVIEASFEVMAQDFIVFDNQSDNGTVGYPLDDSEAVGRRLDNRNICMTTFVFAQLIILLAVFFATLLAMAVFMHMKIRRKTVPKKSSSRL